MEAQNAQDGFQEGTALRKMHHEFIPQNGYELAGKHHEIYLSDPRRTAPDRLKTVLRQPVQTTRERNGL